MLVCFFLNTLWPSLPLLSWLQHLFAPACQVVSIKRYSAAYTHTSVLCSRLAFPPQPFLQWSVADFYVAEINRGIKESYFHSDAGQRAVEVMPQCSKDITYIVATF